MKKNRNHNFLGFPGGSVDRNLPANAGDMSSIHGPKDPICHAVTKPVCYDY